MYLYFSFVLILILFFTALFTKSLVSFGDFRSNVWYQFLCKILKRTYSLNFQEWQERYKRLQKRSHSKIVFKGNLRMKDYIFFQLSFNIKWIFSNLTNLYMVEEIIWQRENNNNIWSNGFLLRLRSSTIAWYE